MAKVDVQDASEDAAVSNVPDEAETSAPVAPAQPVVEQPQKKLNLKTPSFNKRSVFEAVLVLAIIGLGIWSWVLYNDNKDLDAKLSKVNANPQIAVEQQTKDLLTKVGKLIQLPQGETPTIAEVSDAAKARKQSAFFANAQNGDKVLMYVKAGQAILYRPSTNKIVIVAPLTFSGTDSSKKTNTDTSTNNTTDTTNN